MCTCSCRCRLDFFYRNRDCDPVLSLSNGLKSLLLGCNNPRGMFAALDTLLASRRALCAVFRGAQTLS